VQTGGAPVPVALATPLDQHAPLTFTSFDAAWRFAAWMRKVRARGIGTEGDRFDFQVAPRGSYPDIEAMAVPFPTPVQCPLVSLDPSGD
jgi:hypothetical protein